MKLYNQNTLNYTYNALSQSAQKTYTALLTAGKKYRVSFDFIIDGITTASFTLSNGSTQVRDKLTTITSKEITEFTATATNLTLLATLSAGNYGRLAHIDNLEIAEIAEVGESYRFGFNGMEKDNDTYGEGNAYDFGARIYSSRLGKWLAVDPQAAKYVSLSPYHFGNNNPIITIDPNGEENIVVVGGNTTKTNGGHYNQFGFMECAIKQANAYKAEKSTEKTTLIIMNYGYNPEQIDEMVKTSIANGLGNPVIINNSTELVNYINTSSTQFNMPNVVSQDRINDPVTDMSVFSHGQIGSIELSYNVVSESEKKKGTFDATDVNQISPMAFGGEVINSKPQATQIDLYSCNSGTEPSNVGGKSIAQSLNERTGAGVKAFKGRTNYGFINDPENKPSSDINPNGADRLPKASTGSTEVNLPAN